MKLLTLFLVSLSAFSLDLSEVKAEPNHEKRSEKALIYAGELLTGMRTELDTAKAEDIQRKLQEFQAAVDLCVESLAATGKNARKSPKHFKRAEVRLRELNRRLLTLKSDMSIDDRPLLENVTKYVDERIDQLVEATLRGS